MHSHLRLVTSLVLGLLVVPVVACSAPLEEEETGGDTGEYSEALSLGCSIKRANILAAASSSRRRAIERGFTWLDAGVSYSQSKYYKGYRTDCSGFVSMAWELGTSYTTASFISGGGQSFPLTGGYGALAPGDALVRRSNGSGHIVLFLGWNDKAKSEACVLEQASTAQDMQFRTRTAASLRSGGYKAIRADKLAGDTTSSSSAPTGADDEPGDADDTTSSSSGSGKACTSDGACNPGNDGSGQICQGGRCVAGCRSNAQCPGATSCVSGQCR